MGHPVVLQAAGQLRWAWLVTALSITVFIYSLTLMLLAVACNCSGQVILGSSLSFLDVDSRPPGECAGVLPSMACLCRYCRAAQLQTGSASA